MQDMTRDGILFSLLFLAACDGGTETDTAGGKDTDDTGGGSITAPELVINEVLAANDTINADGAGEFDDWIEIYNASDAIVQLDGFYFTDDVETPQQYELPAGRGLSPGDFLLIWCDGQPEQQTATELHAAFKMDKAGDTLFLYYYDGDQRAQADAIEWTDKQTADISAARIPDGSLEWERTNQPTPAAANKPNAE